MISTLLSPADTPTKQHILGLIFMVIAIVGAAALNFVAPSVHWAANASISFGVIGTMLWLLCPNIKSSVLTRINNSQKNKMNDPADPENDIEAPIYTFQDLEELSAAEYRINH